MQRILVLCTGNSCRSQKLHGYLAQDPTFDVASAGIAPHGLNPRAVTAMAEAGIAIFSRLRRTAVRSGGDRVRRRPRALPGAAWRQTAPAPQLQRPGQGLRQRGGDRRRVPPRTRRAGSLRPRNPRRPLLTDAGCRRPGSRSHSRLTVWRGIHHNRSHATCVTQRDRAIGSGGHDRDGCVGRVHDADAGEVGGHGDGAVGVVRQHAPGGRPRLGGLGQVRERLALRMRRPTRPASSAPPTGPVR